MCHLHTNMIRKTEQGWAVYTEDGSRRLSRFYDDRDEAVQRLQEIEYFKTNSRADPTNTAGNRRKVIQWMHRQKREALKEIKQFADTIPRDVTEIPETVITNRRVYTYDLNERDPYLVIREIIERWFGTDGERPADRWFFEMQAQEVVRQTTTTSVQRINDLAEAANFATPYQIEMVLLSEPYRERIRRVGQRVFEEMKGFTTDTANDLARTLSDEMAAGNGIETVKRRIAERFDVKMSRAETIARTELGTAHRDTRREQTKDARDRLGLDAREQWVSALAPTTRSSHAARHLQFYTPEQVAEFYMVDGNAINCLCSQNTVLISKDGTVIGKRNWTKRDRAEVKYLTSVPARERSN